MTSIGQVDLASDGPPGADLGSISTPALILDRSILNANIEAMADHAARYGMELWPHAKTHKSIQIARAQLAAGARGITVATIAEAEAMAHAGVQDLLVAYPPVDAWRLERVVDLARAVRLRVSLDDVQTAVRLDHACESAGVEIGFLWEVDSGNHRCGSPPGEPTAELVCRVVDQLRHVHYDGLMTFAGHAYAAKDDRQLKRIAREELEAVRFTADQLARRGIQSRALSVGSTPTVRQFTDDAAGMEIRPGNYVLGDATQVGLGVASLDECALSVLSTVVSRPTAERVILDAGSKALSSDRMTDRTSGYGVVLGVDGIAIDRLFEEHAIADVPASSPLEVGSRVRIIPNHACATVNLHSTLHVLHDGEIAETWSVAARGWS